MTVNRVEAAGSTEAVKLTVDQVLKDLEEIVQEYGADHTAVCHYSNEKEGDALAPICIAGVWVHKRAPELFPLLDEGDWQNITSVPDEYGYTYNDPCTYRAPIADLAEMDAHRVIWKAQAVQDDSKTWGEALAAAKLLASQIQESAK